MTSVGPETLSMEEEAAASFIQPQQGQWTPSDQQALELRLATDCAFAAAYWRVEKVWAALDAHAGSPQLLARRQQAIAYVRRVSGRRWLKPDMATRIRWRAATAAASVTLALIVAWQLSPYGYRPGQYRTAIGEQRMIELPDQSHIALDAATTLRVRYSEDARVVKLMRGQAQFSVAKDSTRPFKVQVGDRTIVALGTVFTVDFADRKIHVAMVEGRVAVVPTNLHSNSPLAERQGHEATGPHSRSGPLPSSFHGGTSVRAMEASAPDIQSADAIELLAGEELKVSQDGNTTLIPKADIDAATAWREGKVIFRTEPLGEAVQRLNRYSPVQIEIADASLAAQEISGVFEAGDSQGFVHDIQRYLPVVVDSTDPKRIRLQLKRYP